jgi:putative hydrolase
MELIRIAEFPEELILNRSSGEFLSWLEKWRM